MLYRISWTKELSMWWAAGDVVDGEALVLATGAPDQCWESLRVMYDSIEGFDGCKGE
jgi:hypothetical protein